VERFHAAGFEGFEGREGFAPALSGSIIYF
jgi:hypothetical protein